MKPYTREEQRAALAERDWLEATKAPAPCIVCTMLDDYLLMRDQCR